MGTQYFPRSMPNHESSLNANATAGGAPQLGPIVVKRATLLLAH